MRTTCAKRKQTHDAPSDDKPSSRATKRSKAPPCRGNNAAAATQQTLKNGRSKRLERFQAILSGTSNDSLLRFAQDPRLHDPLRDADWDPESPLLHRLTVIHGFCLGLEDLVRDLGNLQGLEDEDEAVRKKLLSFFRERVRCRRGDTRAWKNIKQSIENELGILKERIKEVNGTIAEIDVVLVFGQFRSAEETHQLAADLKLVDQPLSSDQASSALKELAARFQVLEKHVEELDDRIRRWITLRTYFFEDRRSDAVDSPERLNERDKALFVLRSKTKNAALHKLMSDDVLIGRREWSSDPVARYMSAFDKEMGMKALVKRVRGLRDLDQVDAGVRNEFDALIRRRASQLKHKSRAYLSERDLPALLSLRSSLLKKQRALEKARVDLQVERILKEEEFQFEEAHLGQQPPSDLKHTDTSDPVEKLYKELVARVKRVDETIETVSKKKKTP